VESKLGPLGTAAIYCPIVPAPGDCEDGEFFGGMKIGRGNRSTRRKPAPAPLCLPQIPLDHNRDRTQAAAVASYGAAQVEVMLEKEMLRVDYFFCLHVKLKAYRL
jgi:hypothetical protein